MFGKATAIEQVMNENNAVDITFLYNKFRLVKKYYLLFLAEIGFSL